jgi:hypothetical protein
MKTNLLFGLALALLCAACSKTSDPTPSSSATVSPGTYTVTSAILTVNANAYPVSLAQLANTAKVSGKPNLTDDLTLKSDGTFAWGPLTGTYNEARLTTTDLTYDLSPSTSTLTVSNTFDGMLQYAPNYQKGSTSAQFDGFQRGATMSTVLGLTTDFATLNKTKYELLFTKK